MVEILKQWKVAVSAWGVAATSWFTDLLSHLPAGVEAASQVGSLLVGLLSVGLALWDRIDKIRGRQRR